MLSKLGKSRLFVEVKFFFRISQMLTEIGKPQHLKRFSVLPQVKTTLPFSPSQITRIQPLLSLMGRGTLWKGPPLLFPLVSMQQTAIRSTSPPRFLQIRFPSPHKTQHSIHLLLSRPQDPQTSQHATPVSVNLLGPKLAIYQQLAPLHSQFLLRTNSRPPQQ
jgi:hypothetical protein